ncbi:MAG TPA: response regulator, partial [Verrucomicrobiae bacterium]|nr:response regulator [Verrucomicrobiae bacterium]
MSNETPDPATPTPIPPRKRILLIEDEPMARLQLLQKLRESGFDVDVAVSGHLALDRMRATVPDAIFMDLLLPDIKGVDVIKAARQDQKFRDRPIYVCTSAAQFDTWTRRAIKAGATKVFNRAATPMDEIAAQVTAELGGGAPPESKGTTPVASSASNQKSPRAADTPPKTPPVIQPPAERTKREAENSETAARPAPLLRRVFKSFGFSKDPVPAPAVPPPTPPPVRAAAAAPAPVPAAGPEPIPNPSCPEDQAPAVCPLVPAEPYQLNSGTSASFAETLTPSLSDQAAVVSFDETGTIVSANKACATMFGWEDASLVGEGLAALLRPGTDQDVRRFIHERLHGTEGRQYLNVVARRRDGVEFPATVTTLIWSSETKVIRKSDSSFSCLTAIFRTQTAGPGASSVPSVALGKGAGASPVATSPAATAGISQQAYDEIQRQFSAISTEAEALRQSLARRERETGDVTNRLTCYEQEIKRSQAALEAERAERKKTEERSKELAAKLAELEQRSVQQKQNPKNQESDPGANRLAQELSEARAALATVDEAFNQNVAHCGKLEAERLEMRREIEALNARLASLHEQAEEPARRSEELEERLQGVLKNLDRMKSDPEARSEVERNLETELGAAKAAAQHAETCLREEVDRSQSFERRLDVLCSNLRQEQAERSKRFEEECARHREEREALNRLLAAEQEKADESKRHAEELEGNLVGNQADLERVRSELERRIEEHRRSEAEWRQKLEEA